MKKKQTIHVEGMTCGHCVQTVETAILGVADVKKAKVNLKKKEAEIWFTAEPTSLQPIITAIEQAGYEGSLLI